MRQTIVLFIMFFLLSCNGETSSKATKKDLGSIADTNSVITSTNNSVVIDSLVKSEGKTNYDNIMQDPLVKDALNNFAWQWRNNGDGGGADFTVNGVSIYSSDKNYHVLTVLEKLIKGGNNDEAFNMLLNGQRHAPSVQEEYKTIISKYGDKIFWELVCSASYPDHSADLNDATANINWLKGNNAESYTKGKQDFNSKNYVSGMYWLMWGQRHNPSITETFRATFRDNKDAFIDLVN
jgi:hypothetical protein